MRNLAYWCFLSVGSSVLAWPTMAQQTSGPVAEATPTIGQQDLLKGASAESATASVGQGSGNEIVVTGSRIERNATRAPTPLLIVSQEQLAARAPSSIADALNQLPQFQGSNSQYQINLAAPQNATAANNLNLRNLGSVRALTLFDGRRLPPGGGSGLVDANVIPQMLVQRVDVVTGGASAAYGSDAVSGVINFVLNKRFEGLRGVAQNGISERGDNASRRFGLVGGLSLMDGRLHLIGSAEYYKSEGIDSVTDRKYGRERWVSVGVNGGIGGSSANPLIGVRDAHIADVTFNGVFSTGGLAGRQILPDGSIVPYVPGQVVGSGVCIDCDGAYHDNYSLVPKLQTDQYFARAEYEFSDRLSVFAQGLYGHSRTVISSGRIFHRPGTGQLVIFNDNAFLPGAARAALANSPQSGFARFSPDLAEPDPRSDVDTWNLVGGIQGKFGGSWSWDASYSVGRSTQDTAIADVDNVHLRAALDAVRDPATGNIVCRVTLTNPGVYPGCVPINLFGKGSPSADAIAYVGGVSKLRAVNKLQTFSANLRGNLLDIWAGPISIAVGVEYRKQSLDQVTTSDPRDTLVTTGIRGFAGQKFIASNLAGAKGSLNVKEGYAEILVPLARDLPFAQALDLNAAYRYTDYSTSGSVRTWKVGVTWEPVDGVRFRGTRSRDIRAPTLFELFAGQQGVVTNLADPRTGVTGSVLRITGGNRDLKPETANTWTGGVVLQPRFTPGVTLSVDYYSISIKDAIATAFTLRQIVQLCEESGGTDSLCSLIQRPGSFSDRSPGNFPTSVQEIALNVANAKTSGVDVELGYRHQIGEATIGARLLGSYLIKFDQQQAENSSVFNFAGNSDISDRAGGLPRLRGSLNLNYDRGPLSIQLTERLVGKSKRSLITYFVDNQVPARVYTDVNFSYDVKAGSTTVQLFMNVANALDVDAPLIPSSSAAPGLAYPTYRALYDVVGRSFTFGARVKL